MSDAKGAGDSEHERPELPDNEEANGEALHSEPPAEASAGKAPQERPVTDEKAMEDSDTPTPSEPKSNGEDTDQAPNAADGEGASNAKDEGGDELVGAKAEMNGGEGAMSSHDEEEEEDEEEDEDDTPDASPRAQVKGEGDNSLSNQSFDLDPFLDGDDSGTEEDQAAFMMELERFHKEHSLEFKPPKFYGKGLNCLKLWRQVARLGGHEQVTACKLWRQVGETFRPPKTCTTVSWSFRIFYEKALLEYEKHKVRTGQLQIPISSFSEPSIADREVGGNQSSASTRARRDAAARAMQGWHAHRLLGNGVVGDPIIKDKGSIPLAKRGLLKRKKASSLERAFKVARTKVIKSQEDLMVVDVGEPADWVKINVRQTKDCFEIYALVPGLLREEVHVQSDPAGRLVITGDPEQPDNPWGVTPFKKVINLPSRIDPHQTSAVVTLHGQLFVRAPFEHSDI